MSDPILLFLAIDAVALLVLGACGAVLPLAVCGFVATMANGLGLLLCLPPLLLRTPATALGVPIGPPGLALHIALDPLSAFFLAAVFLAGSGIAAFEATAAPAPQAGSVRRLAFSVAGATFTLLAADGVSLAIGAAVLCGAVWLPGNDRRVRWTFLVPLLLLAAVCLLAPSGFAPQFDTIRTAPVDPDHAAATAALTMAAVAVLVWSPLAWPSPPASPDASPLGIAPLLAGPRPAGPPLAQGHLTLPPPALVGWDERNRTRDALAAGVLMPAGSYLLLRLIADLAGGVAQTGSGFALILAGGAGAIIQGWEAVRHPAIDGSVGCLLRRQVGIAMMGVGLGLIGRAADLPGAASFALAATFLCAIGSSVAGVLATLAVHALQTSAGTARLSRLGGLVHAMPTASAALSAGLLGLVGLPPGLGFASLWLLFAAILSAPRTGGLLFQLPLALAGAAMALSAALAAAAVVRLIGVAVLGRPRTPLAAGAHEGKSPWRAVLLALGTLSVLAGILPGPVLWALAEPAIRNLTGTPPGTPIGLALLSPSTGSPTYLALPVFAVLALATGAAMLASGWRRKEGKAAGPWIDGMQPPAGLPFGEPAAQSAGDGFLPALPDLKLPRWPLPAALRLPRAPSAATGMWLLLAAFGVLLLVVAVVE